MIYITQLIYIIDGQENIFDQFEDVAIPIIAKYNGRLLFRVRPNGNSFIGPQLDKPYEIHLVEFDSEQDFENFKKDEERKNFLHLKEKSIKASTLIQGIKTIKLVGRPILSQPIFRPLTVFDCKPCNFFGERRVTLNLGFPIVSYGSKQKIK